MLSILDRDKVREVVIRRLDGIRTRSTDMVSQSVAKDLYTKFDDWPPYSRQGVGSLQEEAAAFKVLDEYRYEIMDLQIEGEGDSAIATFHLDYSGDIRKKPFDMTSRVSMMLVKRGSDWLIAHEHFSRFPTPLERTEAHPLQPARKEQTVEQPQAAKPQQDKMEEAIVELLGEGGEMDPMSISKELSSRVGGYVDTSSVVKKCRELVEKGLLEQIGEGYYLAKYRLRRG